VKVGLLVQELKGGTHTEHDDLISLHFSSFKEGKDAFLCDW